MNRVNSLSGALLCAIVYVFVGCSSADKGTSPSPPARPVPTYSTLVGVKPPGIAIIYGITLYDERGLGGSKWGNPTFAGVFFFPNPFFDSCTFMFSLRDVRVVQAWVERAYGPGEAVRDESTVGLGGGVIVRQESGVIRRWPDRVVQGAGWYVWDGTDNDGNPVPPGFYRAYFSAGPKNTGWADVLLARSCDDVPRGIYCDRAKR